MSLDVEAVVGKVKDVVDVVNSSFDKLEQPWHSLVALAAGAATVTFLPGWLAVVVLVVLAAVRVLGEYWV